MKAFEYAAPREEAEVLGLLSDRWGQTEVLAGGTDLVALMKKMIVTPDRVVNIKDVESLRGISADSTGVTIGATTTLDEILAVAGAGRFSGHQAGHSRHQQPAAAVPGNDRRRALPPAALLVLPQRLRPAGQERPPGQRRPQPLSRHLRQQRSGEVRASFAARAGAGGAGSPRADHRSRRAGRKLPAAGVLLSHAARRAAAGDGVGAEPTADAHPARLRPMAAPAPRTKCGTAKGPMIRWPPPPLLCGLATASSKRPTSCWATWRPRRGSRPRRRKPSSARSSLRKRPNAAGDAAVARATPLSENGYKVQLARVAVKRAILLAAGLETGGF